MTEKASPPSSPVMRGWLSKWTNYIKGYQKRWFVLENDVLSYYRTQAEMSHTCRGTISLQGALIHTDDQCHFVVSNGGTQTFHLKATNEVERQRWVTALELAKARAIRALEEFYDDLDELPIQTDTNAIKNVVKNLSATLEELRTCNELIGKHGAALQRLLVELEQMDLGAASNTEVAPKVKAVNERATLFRITTNAMINACGNYVEQTQLEGRKWQRMLQNEHEQRLRLEEMVEQLARQHSTLEKAARLAPQEGHRNEGKERKGSISSKQKNKNNEVNAHSDDEFYDALDADECDFVVTLPSSGNIGHRRTASGVSTGSKESEGALIDNNDEYSSGSSSDMENDSRRANRGRNREVGVVVRKSAKKAESMTAINSNAGFRDGTGARANKSSNDVVTSPGGQGSDLVPGALGNERPKTPDVEKPYKPNAGMARRTRIVDRPNVTLNLWSIMKNCIGKDLTKIPMPVNFSEPLSMLQRLTEEFEYTELLDQAAACTDSCLQLAYVAAFTVSAYATTSNRTGKPFNPLLGETYECDRREDIGWRSFAEQVSHHPPMAALHCEGKGWKCWKEFTMTSKFRGKYLQILPLGMAHLEFSRTGHHYTWRKVTTTVNNIIVGKLWVDQHGDMDIVNHKSGDKCHLKYVQYSYFSKETARKVTGAVADADGNIKYVLSGTWDGKLDCAPVITNPKQNNKGNSVLETGSPMQLWQRKWPPPEYDRMYNFTVLAVQLNQMEDGVSPTDTRQRPDQRLMEQGYWEDANKEKLRLEEKQRQTRRQREMEAETTVSTGAPYESYEPKWFKQIKDPITGNPMFAFTDEYWQCKAKQDWSRCPTIF